VILLRNEVLLEWKSGNRDDYTETDVHSLWDFSTITTKEAVSARLLPSERSVG
jgi:hypothetical protein